MARFLPSLLALVMLAACTAPTLAPLRATHPASPDAAEAPVPAPPAALGATPAGTEPAADTAAPAHHHHAH
jgi:hypothetical protein